MLDLDNVAPISNKVIFVTGGNSGIGFEIAKNLSCRGANVIIACRDDAKGLEALKQIDSNSEYVNLDLRNFASIDRCLDSITAKHPQIDILINNAGVMFPPLTRTNEQLEMTFAVNYIGHFFLTNKMMPLLRNVKGSRVVNMSSIAQYKVEKIDWENINSQIRYDKRESYNLSNLFRIMFTLELELKLREKNYQTIAVACHPGVTLTNITRFMPRILRLPTLTKLMNRFVFHPPHKAAMSALIATTSSEVGGGDFIGLDTKKQHKGVPTIVSPNQLAYDKGLRDTLWRKSVEITGVDLE